MFKCDDCGRVFGGSEAIIEREDMNGEGAWLEYSTCPNCNSDQLAEVTPCEVCGEYTEETVCENCYNLAKEALAEAMGRYMFENGGTTDTLFELFNDVEEDVMWDDHFTQDMERIARKHKEEANAKLYKNK